MRLNRMIAMAVAMGALSGCKAFSLPVFTGKMGKLAVRLSGDCSNSDVVTSDRLLDVIEGCGGAESSAADVPAAVAQSRSCIQRVTSLVDRIETASCRKRLLPIARDGVKSTVISHLKGIAAGDPAQADSGTNDPRLIGFAGLISDWERLVRRPIYSDPRNIEAFTNDPGLKLDQAFGADLDAIHGVVAQVLARRTAKRSGSGSEVTAKSFSESGSTLRDFVNVLLRDERPAPLALLRFSALAFEPIRDRARSEFEFVDLRCSLAQACGQANYQQLDGWAVFRLVAELGSEASDASSDSNRLGALRGQVRTFMTNLSQNRSKYQEALRSTLIVKDLNLKSAPLQAFEPLAFPWVVLVQDARQVLHAIQTQGRSKSSLQEFLGRFTAQEIDRISSDLDKIKASLQSKREDFEKRRISLAQELLSESDQKGKAATLDSLIQSAGVETSMMLSDVTGVQDALRNDSVAFGRFMERTQAIMESPSYKNRFANASLVPVVEGIVQVRGAEFQAQLPVSSGSSPASPRLERVVQGADQKILRFEASAGDVLSLQVSGNYAPTCALSKTFVEVDQVESAQTGPEGFMISFSEGKAVAVSSVTSTSERSSESESNNRVEYQRKFLSDCSNFSVNVGGGVNIGIVQVSGGVTYSWPKDCASKLTSNTISKDRAQVNDSSQTSDRREQASFEKGFRSVWAPFPNVPAGALLAVEVDRNTGGVLDVRVVHRASALPIERDADVYLAVNDCTEVRRKGDPGGLSVRYSLSRSPISVGAVSALTQAMAKGGQRLRVETDARVRQGELTPNEISALKGEITAMISTELATRGSGSLRIADFPVIDELYQTWIAHELVQLERKVRLLQISRRLELQAIRYRDLLDQRRNQAESQPIREALLEWAITGLDRRELRLSVEQVLRYLEYRAVPFLNTVAPGSGRSAAGELSRLIEDLTLDTDQRKMAVALEKLIEELSFSQSMRVFPRGQENRKLIVSFPRTTRSVSGLPAVYEVTQDAQGHSQYRSTSVWNSAPFNESDRVWSSFLGGSSELTFKLGLEDIYSNATKRAVVPCDKRAPFIRSMSVVFVVDRVDSQERLNALELETATLLPDQVRVPGLSGVETFQVIDPSFRRDSVPIRFADSANALDIVKSTEAIQRTAALGMTPLGEFTLLKMAALNQDPDFRRIKDSVSEILLVFTYDSLSADRELSWIPSCK